MFLFNLKLSPLCFSLWLVPEPPTLFIANTQQRWSNLIHLIVCNKSVYTYIIYLHIFYYRVLATFVFYSHGCWLEVKYIYIYIFFIFLWSWVLPTQNIRGLQKLWKTFPGFRMRLTWFLSGVEFHWGRSFNGCWGMWCISLVHANIFVTSTKASVECARLWYTGYLADENDYWYIQI